MNKKEKLLILGTIAPLTTYASGNDIFDWFGIELLLIIVFLIALSIVKINRTGKGLMVLFFVIAEYLTMRLTDDIPYSDNESMINLVSMVIPGITIIISFWLLRARFKKKIN
jgi:hypothetical protein